MRGLHGFGTVVRQRRRDLGITQNELASRAGISVAYVIILEANRSRPSERTIVKLAKALGSDPSELFFSANPQTKNLVSQRTGAAKGNAWEGFSNDKSLLARFRVNEEEMKILCQVAAMGSVRSSRDFIYILNAIRHALGR